MGLSQAVVLLDSNCGVAVSVVTCLGGGVGTCSCLNSFTNFSFGKVAKVAASTSGIDDVRVAGGW